MRIEFERDDLGNPIGTPVADHESARRPSRERVLEGSYARLEPLDPSHTDDLWDAFTDDAEGRTWTYLGIGPFTDVQPFAEWVLGASTSTDPFFYAIIDRTSGRAVGFGSYLRIDPAARTIEVGWLTFSPRMQRTPVSTDAMFLMMREAFALGNRRYEWKCNALNAPSIAAAHRLEDWPHIARAFMQWLSPDNFDASGKQQSRLSDLTAPFVASRWPALTIEVAER